MIWIWENLPLNKYFTSVFLEVSKGKNKKNHQNWTCILVYTTCPHLWACQIQEFSFVFYGDNNCEIVTWEVINVFNITFFSFFFFTETKILMSFPNTWRVWSTCTSSLETSVVSLFLFYLLDQIFFSSWYCLHFNIFFLILFHSKLKTKMYLALQSLELDLTKMMHMFRYTLFFSLQRKNISTVLYSSKKILFWTCSYYNSVLWYYRIIYYNVVHKYGNQ